jgi:hypothetical protein
VAGQGHRRRLAGLQRPAALPVNVLAPDAGNARVFARGWAPGNPALSRRLSTLDLDAITVVGAVGQPIDALTPCSKRATNTYGSPSTPAAAAGYG